AEDIAAGGRIREVQRRGPAGGRRRGPSASLGLGRRVEGFRRHREDLRERGTETVPGQEVTIIIPSCSKGELENPTHTGGGTVHVSATVREDTMVLPVQGPPGAQDASEVPAVRPRSLWTMIKVIELRLRFVVLVTATGLVFAYAETLANYYAKWTR